MAIMTKRERIKAVLAGQPVDRTPVGFWRHWPGDDQQENSLVQITLEFQHQFDLDFIKLPVSSAFTVADWGVNHQYQGNLTGDRTFLNRIVTHPDDWDAIKPLDVLKGTFGWHLGSLRQLVQKKTVTLR